MPLGRTSRRRSLALATAGSPPARPRLRRAGAAATAAGMCVAAAGLMAPRTVHADVTFDQALFALINQDRAQAGLPALRWNATLSNLGESGSYGGCGFTVAGRAQDMIQRNYFAHPILGCGTQNVFNVMHAYGVNYQAAGENIGWESGLTDPQQAASYLNQMYMSSTEHRANILNPSFTDVGVGSWRTAPGQAWTGGGGSLSNVFMSTEEFAQLPTTTASAPPPNPVIAGPGPGYWLVAGDGGVFDFAASGFYGSMGGHPLAQPVVSAAPTADRRGYWMVARDGGVFAFGDAPFEGSMGGRRLNAPVVGMAPTASGHGYWMVASDGGIFAFGDAPFHGSMGGRRLNAPIVGIAPTPSGNGYWLVASDGGIFAFGGAHFYGSMGGHRLNQPIVGIAPTATGNGYWLVASDGGIFAFGDARFYGSTGGRALAQPVVRMEATPDGGGYWLVARDGGVFNFGDAPFHGSTGAIRLVSPVVSLIA